MSTAYAMAAVSAVLREQLRSTLVAHKVETAVGGSLDVSALPPDRVLPPGGPEPNRLNLFLYAVNHNPGWRNMRLPARDAAGDRVGNPFLALDLHYLLTAFAANEFGAEVLLGHGMQILHETPFLTRSVITRVLASAAIPVGLASNLKACGLADQIEQIKITPQPMNLDEMSKVWTSLQGHYRATAAYLVTVVLIESLSSARSALPVLTRNIAPVPFQQLVLDSVTHASDDTLPILPGEPIRLRGHGLRADAAQVLIAGQDLTAAVTRFADTEIELTLPKPLPPDLRAGLLTARVVHPVPSLPGFTSNLAAFALRPSVTAQRKSFTNSTLNGVAVRGGDIELTLTPLAGAEQQVTLLLNERNAPANRPGRAYRFDAPPGNGVIAPATSAATVLVPYRNVVPGSYLVRAQVDGAESVLALGASKYDKPNVTI